MAIVYPDGSVVGDFLAGSTSSGWQPSSFAYGAHFTLASGGTITQLSTKAFCASGGPYDVKLAVYTSGGSLLGSTTVSVTATSSLGLAWTDSGVLSITVPSAGLYYVLASAASDNLSYQYASVGAGSFATEAYASFPASSESITGQGDAGQLYPARMDFTAGASGPTGAQLSRMLLGIG